MNRLEAQARTRPIRESIVQIANFLQNVHGVRPEARERTDPRVMTIDRLRRWATRYGVDAADLDEEEFRAACVERQESPPRLPDDAESLDNLQAAYDTLKGKRQAILDDLDEDADDVVTGPAQTIVPPSLSVEMVQGMVGQG